MNREEAIRIISESSFAQHKDLLLSHLRPSVRIRLQPDAAEIDSGVSESWFGGLPCLPRGVDWPRWDRTKKLESDIRCFENQSPGKADFIIKKLREELAGGVKPSPLSFLGQLSLKELHTAVPLEHWPLDGSLAFFYDNSQVCWGAAPAERGCSRVFYFPESVKLHSVNFPDDLDEDSQLSPSLLTFEESWTLPSVLKIGEKEFNRRTSPEYKLLHKLLGSVDYQGEIHRFGGHAEAISKCNMEMECQLVTNGFSFNDSNWTQDERHESLMPGVADWQLILQMDSDEKLGATWGDIGRIYFWARWQDIAAQKFDNAWLILESD